MVAVRAAFDNPSKSGKALVFCRDFMGINSSQIYKCTFNKDLGPVLKAF